MAKDHTANRPLPPVGAAFAVSLRNGLWGGCRVIRVGDPGFAGQPHPDAVLVGAVSWVGPHPLAAVATDFDRPLVLTHHNYLGHPAAVWVGGHHGPPPPTFVPIGTVSPSPLELARLPVSYGHWSYIPTQIEAQWRWDHDREAVLREDAKAAGRDVDADHAARAAVQHALDRLTLAGIRNRRPFADWRRLWPAAAVTRARGIFRDTIDQLIALGPEPTLADAEPILRQCVEQFNRLDGTGGFTIETVERDDICDHFAHMVHAAGLAKYGSVDLTKPWRKW